MSKKYHKNERHFCLVAHIFTKLSQNVSLINVYILIYWHVRCDWKLRNTLWFYCIFGYFRYIIEDHSCLNCCISTKLSQIVSLIISCTLVYQHAKCDCSLWKVLWFSCVFLEFSYIISHLERYQTFTNCVKTDPVCLLIWQ